MRKCSGEAFEVYLSSPPHWVLLGAGIFQAWVISREGRRPRWCLNFLAPGLYTVIDVLLEGPAAFLAEPYHIVYWGWVCAMTTAILIQDWVPWLATLLKAMLLVLLLPATYMLAEWQTAAAAWGAYWLDEPAHLFILTGTGVLGMVLGVSAIMRRRFEVMLYRLAGHFEQIASWSFDRKFISQSYGNDAAFALDRIERTVLFMDIRGFTPWSEAHSPDEVVEMASRFYRVAEPIIKHHGGFKIQMTGDEIMTRFAGPDAALAAAVALQPAVSSELAAFGLGAGIGVHTGAVVEGLVGGEQTRLYGIFGDTVNTAARLQGQARAGEIVISRTTWDRCAGKPQNLEAESVALSLKGKSEPLPVLVLRLRETATAPADPGRLTQSPDR